MKKAILTAAVALIATSALAKKDAMSLVPNDAVSVGVVRLAEMRSSPLSSALFQQTDKVTTDGDAAAFMRDAGLQPSRDIDVVVVSTSPRGSAFSADADVLVGVEGRFNVERLTSALLARGASKKSTANGSYIVLPEHESREDKRGAVSFIDSHLAVIGNEEAVTKALASYATGGTSFATATGLGRDVARIDPHATAWAIVDVARAQRLAGGPRIGSHSDPAKAITSALKGVSTIALWATDSGDSLKLNAIGLSSDTETLELLEDTVRGALAAMRLAVQEKSPALVGVLRKFTVSRTNDSISISGSVPAETFKDWTKSEKHVR